MKISIIFIGSLLAALSEIISISSIPVFVTLLVDPQLFQNKLSNYIDISFLINIPNGKLILFGGIFLTIIFFAKNVFNKILIYFQSSVIRDLNVKLTNRLYKLYLYAPYFVHLKMNNAELVRNIISETSQVISIILKIVTLFRELLVLIFIFFLVLYVDILVTFIVFLVLSFCAGFFFYFTKKLFIRMLKKCKNYPQQESKMLMKLLVQLKK